jgi:hypothetical protein
MDKKNSFKKQSKSNKHEKNEDEGISILFFIRQLHFRFIESAKR